MKIALKRIRKPGHRWVVHATLRAVAAQRTRLRNRPVLLQVYADGAWQDASRYQIPVRNGRSMQRTNARGKARWRVMIMESMRPSLRYRLYARGDDLYRTAVSRSFRLPF